jgi:hypothetical protein
MVEYQANRKQNNNNNVDQAINEYFDNIGNPGGNKVYALYQYAWITWLKTYAVCVGGWSI